MVTVADAAKLAKALPEVTESTRYGGRTWAVGDRVFAWVRAFSKADLKRFGDEEPPSGPILAIMVADLMEKEAALAANPEAFFTIPHFNGYAAVLVQLDKVTKTTLKKALAEGCRAMARKKPARKAKAASTPRARAKPAKKKRRGASTRG
jgi:hypothetical protein